MLTVENILTSGQSKDQIKSDERENISQILRIITFLES